MIFWNISFYYEAYCRSFPSPFSISFSLAFLNIFIAIFSVFITLGSHFDLSPNLIYVNGVSPDLFPINWLIILFCLCRYGKIRPYKCLVSVVISENVGGGDMCRVNHLFISLCFGKRHINSPLSLVSYAQLAKLHFRYLANSFNSSL